MLSELLNIFLNLDKEIILFVQQYGLLVYPLLFTIIFLETGIVVTPFLPGDSLIFAAGTLASVGSLNLFLLFIILISAAILGDTANYWIGKYFGERIAKSGFKKQYIQKTRNFFEKYGGKAIILARFVPIIRTFAPFIAGIGKMKYAKFISYNIIGGIAWVSLFLFAGFYFGNVPFVKNNFEFVIIAIIIISVLPAIIEFLRNRSNKL